MKLRTVADSLSWVVLHGVCLVVAHSPRTCTPFSGVIALEHGVKEVMGEACVKQPFPGAASRERKPAVTSRLFYLLEWETLRVFILFLMRD